MKSDLHTPACKESPHFCICAVTTPRVEGAKGNLVATGGWPDTTPKITTRVEFNATPSITVSTLTVDQLANSGAASSEAPRVVTVPMMAFQAQVRRNNELVDQVAFWKRSAYWATALAGAAVLASIIVIGWS